MKKKKGMVLISLCAAGLIFASCSTTPICVTSSVTPLSGKEVAENLGRTEGSDTAGSVLGLFMIGRPDLDLAIKDALKEKNGDTLINVRCYERWIYFVIGSVTTVKVEGEAIKFASAETEAKDKKKDKKK